MPPLRKTGLVITGIGAISSVGHDAATTCAAIRAGIQRPREVLHYEVLDAAEQESTPLVARPIAGYTEGFTGIGLWTRLAAAALDDWQRSMVKNAMPGFWDRTAVVAVTPALAHDRFAEDEYINLQSLRAAYLTPLLEHLGWTVPSELAFVATLGGVGAVQALDKANELLVAARADRVVVVCADSLLDPLSLEWLDGAERLKGGDQPFGLVPGEAAACFVLESATAAQPRALAAIDGWSVARARAQPLSGDPMLGDALAEAILAALTAAGIESFSGMSICDLNGEPWRSQEWGTARVRLGQRLTDEVDWILPCDALGDTGSASAAVSICMAVQALRRSYAPDGRVLITASGDDGSAGALCASS